MLANSWSTSSFGAAAALHKAAEPSNAANEPADTHAKVDARACRVMLPVLVNIRQSPFVPARASRFPTPGASDADSERQIPPAIDEQRTDTLRIAMGRECVVAAMCIPPPQC